MVAPKITATGPRISEDMRDIELRIGEDGQVTSRGKVLCTIQPGDMVTLETPCGAYFVTIHRESSPGRRKQSRPARPLAKVRKLHILEGEAQP